MSNLVLELVRPTLPWDPLPGESTRFRALMIIFLLLALMIWIIVPRIEIPKVDRTKAEAVPESLAKVVMKRKEVPPPPPVAKKEEIKKEEVVKKEEVAKPTDEAAPKPVVTDLQKSAAKARASQAIQEAGFDDLADLRDMNVGATGTPTGMPGQAGNGTGGFITNTQEAGTSRNLITSKAGSGSGAVGSYGGPVSSGYGGGKAGGKGTAGLLGAGGAGGSKLQSVQSNISASAVAAGGDVKVGKDGKARRTQENVRKGFDRYTGRVNNLYQRALRDDPTMQGTITLKLTIQPDGSVSEAGIGNSQLNNPDLESKVLALVKGFNFGAENVEAWSGNYTLNFFSN